MVNSRNAEAGFKQICNELNKDIKYELIPKNIWGNSRIYESELSLINKWKSFLINFNAINVIYLIVFLKI